MLIDTHCHLTDRRFADDLPTVLQGMLAAGVEHAICIGTGCADGEAVAALVSENPQCIGGAVGIDPFSAHAAGEAFDDHCQRLAALLAAGTFCALGEIGLDYHYDLGARSQQQERFVRQLALAERHRLPVVVHLRECWEDAIALLREHPGNHGVIHSFTGGPAEAAACLELGWHLGFNGIATFKNARAIAAAARCCPADRLLLETDSPYLAPVPLRGKRCEPAFLVHTARFIAGERGERFEDLCAWTTRNAIALFSLPPGVADGPAGP